MRLGQIQSPYQTPFVSLTQATPTVSLTRAESAPAPISPLVWSVGLPGFPVPPQPQPSPQAAPVPEPDWIAERIAALAQEPEPPPSPIVPGDGISNIARIRTWIPTVRRYLRNRWEREQGWRRDSLDESMAQKLGIYNAAPIPWAFDGTYPGQGKWDEWQKHFRAAYERWIQDPGFNAERIAKAVAGSHALFQVFESVPWPHRWFWGVVVNVTAQEKGFSPPAPRFYQGWRYHDPELAASDYIPKPIPEIERDLAVYLVRNATEIEKQVQGEIAWYVERQKREQEKVAAATAIPMTFLKILMAGASIVIGGMAIPVQVVFTGIKTLTDVGLGYVAMRDLAAKQKDMMQTLMQALDLPQSSVDAFKAWIVARLRPQVPEEKRVEAVVQRPVEGSGTGTLLTAAALFLLSR